jgi:hypothetical protein
VVEGAECEKWQTLVLALLLWYPGDELGPVHTFVVACLTSSGVMGQLCMMLLSNAVTNARCAGWPSIQ